VTSYVLLIFLGVVGLTTALVLQETNKYRVTIIADKFPTDPKSIHYTSHWAVCPFVSLGGSDFVLTDLYRVLTMSYPSATSCKYVS
jgi:hypothetical protein